MTRRYQWLRERRAWLLVPLLWLFIAVVESLPPAAFRNADGSYYLMPWSERLLVQFQAYSFWMLLTPVTALFIHALIERGGRLRIPLSIIGGIVYVLGMAWVRASLRVPFMVQLSEVVTSPPSWRLVSLGLPPAFLAYGLTLGVVLGWRYIGARAALSAAQLTALRAQLHPHFLFNTLNGIAALTEERPREAREMLARLGDLLRRALETTEHDTVALTQEIEWAEDYVELHRARFGDHLAVEFNIDPDAIAARVPHLILQPIVENAIEHGLQGQSDGVVRISAERMNQRLVLTVRDNGRGLDGNGAGAGIGLTNTRSRLRALFGDDQRLTLRSVEPHGAEVQIDMPFVREPE